MLEVELFTDPACPFAFSAEPVRRRLRWHYGDGLRWTTRMIVLTREPGEAEKLAEGAGLDADQIAGWSAQGQVAQALAQDAHAARSPSLAARALNDKLGGPPEQRRYTAPSYVINGVAIPGFNPIEVYETVIANQAPQLNRRGKPSDIGALLGWAQAPLATAEVALIMQCDPDQARATLSAVADFQPAGADGYWTLRAA